MDIKATDYRNVRGFERGITLALTTRSSDGNSSSSNRKKNNRTNYSK